MSLQSLKTPAYSNWLMLGPDGSEMFRCAEKRARWYLNRDLAEIVANDPPTVKLKFIPNGNGNQGDEFSLSKKHNRCVRCGTEEDLTKHHIVPSMYRRFLPDNVKSRSSHDVVPICIPCHNEYEAHASQLKNLISLEFAQFIQVIKKDANVNAHFKVVGLCRALRDHCDVIPAERQVQMGEEIVAYFGYHPTIEDLRAISTEPVKSPDPGKAVVEQILATDQLESFVKRWRQHFIDIAQPKRKI